MGSKADKTISWDGTTNQGVDSKVGAGEGILVAHAEVHEAGMYHASHLYTTIGDDANADMLIKVGANKELHSAIAVVAGGDAYFYLYSGTTTSAIGTAITPRNMNREDGTDASDADVRHTPTVSSAGTQLAAGFIPGGQKNQAVGGDARSGAEWILAKSTDYLARVTNKAGSAKDISIVLEYYQES